MIPAVRPLLAATLALGVVGCVVTHGRRIDVGGYKMAIRCGGRGEPAVLLDAGLGDNAVAWDWVRPGIEPVARVCAWDRAGLGGSDPSPFPRTSRAMVEEARTLVRRAGVVPPYVLVGHSFGGLNARLWASVHPGEVAGLVLVDATPEDFPETVRSLRSEEERLRLQAALAISPIAAEEERALPSSVAELRAAPPLPPVPRVVIRSGRFNGTPGVARLWESLQEDLARRLGTQARVAERSGHEIPFDQPEIVVEAVKEVLATVRFRRPAGSGGSVP